MTTPELNTTHASVAPHNNQPEAFAGEAFLKFVRRAVLGTAILSTGCVVETSGQGDNAVYCLNASSAPDCAIDGGSDANNNPDYTGFFDAGLLSDGSTQDNGITTDGNNSETGTADATQDAATTTDGSGTDSNNCTGGLDNCGSAGCVDTSTDEENCGLCGQKCSGTCINGQCHSQQNCTDPLLLCQNISNQAYTCVDPRSDRDNCGDCNAQCSPGYNCINSVCVQNH